MGFSRQEYWSGLPCPTPGDLPIPGIEPKSLMPPALASGPRGSDGKESACSVEDLGSAPGLGRPPEEGVGLVTQGTVYTALPGAAAAAKSLQSCPTLRDPIDGSPPGSPVPGILQARTLEWVAISFSNA